jgi:hypothetical protein
MEALYSTKPIALTAKLDNSSRLMRGTRTRAPIIGAFCAALLLALTPADSLGALSGHKSILLGEGKRKSLRWGVSLKRSKGKRGGQQPCIGASLLSTRPNASGLYEQSFLQVCGMVKIDAPPNVVSLSAGKGSGEVTVVGIAVEPRIAAIALDLSPIGKRTISLRPLNERQRRNADVRKLRYAAFSLPGAPCLRQIIGYGKAGEELYRGPMRACSEEMQ